MPPKEQFIGIDFLRFAAALMVVSLHLVFSISEKVIHNQLLWPLINDTHFPQALPFTWFGWVGVQIFFVISGFVIAFSANGASPFRFLTSRVNRLLPAVWVAAPLTALVLFGNHLMPLSEALTRLTKSLIFFPFGPWVDGPYWTLGVEIMFYTLVFLLLLTNKFRKITLVMGIIGSISSLVWLSLLIIGTFMPEKASALAQALHYKRLPMLLLLTSGCNFAVGVFLWQMLLHKAATWHIPVLALCIAGSLAEILLHEGVPFSAAMPTAIPALVWLMGLLVLILNIQYHGKFNTIYPQFFRTIGLMTYPLYLLHNTIGTWAVHMFKQAGFTSNAALVLTFAGLLVANWVVAIQLEPRLRQPLKLVFSKLEETLRRTCPQTGLLKKPQAIGRTSEAR